MTINDNILISKNDTVKNALKKLDKSAKKLLLVINEKREFIGTISDGDIRRYILKDGSLEKDINGVFHDDPFYIREDNFSLEKIKQILLANKIDLLPVVDSNKKVIDAITWEEAFSEEGYELKPSGYINIPVIVMAGGKGSRMEPFTNILPKPLIPIGNKSILELIIEEFRYYGAKDYNLILNYKSGMIKAYFDGLDKDYSIKYFQENDFYGTAGGLKLIENSIEEYFFVSNCDVLVKANYEEVFNFHKEKKALLTIFSSMQHYKIPYGVVKFKDGGNVSGIIEKPEYTFHVNTGVYLLSKECLTYIPKEKYFDMTDLINELLKNNKKVLTYPINESDYIDIGQWKEYQNAVKKLCLL